MIVQTHKRLNQLAYVKKLSDLKASYIFVWKTTGLDTDFQGYLYPAEQFEITIVGIFCFHNPTPAAETARTASCSKWSDLLLR